MFVAFKNFCEWTAVSGGTGNFVVAAATVGHDIPTNCNVTIGKTYSYYAQSPDGLVWENGFGAFTLLGLVRTTILSTSNGNTSPVNFASPPIVDLFPSPSGTLEPVTPATVIPSGTAMLFQQSAAPVGWTKQTAHDDKALRVVAGTASSGGSNAFSTVFAQTVVGGTAITIAQMPAHTHDVLANAGSGALTTAAPASQAVNRGPTTYPADAQTTGGGLTHNHSILMSIEYVDVIICTKD